MPRVVTPTPSNASPEAPAREAKPVTKNAPAAGSRRRASATIDDGTETRPAPAADVTNEPAPEVTEPAAEAPEETGQIDADEVAQVADEVVTGSEPAADADPGDEIPDEPDTKDEPAEQQPADITISDDQYRAVMEAFKAPKPGQSRQPDFVESVDEGEPEPARPAAKAAAAGATADDIDAAIEALEEAGDETTAKTMRIMAGRLRAMEEKAKADREQSEKAAKQQRAAEYEAHVHGLFDAAAERGKRDIYGHRGSGRISADQIKVRRLVHDAAVSIFSRLAGQTFNGRQFTAQDAVAAAERSVLEMLGKQAPAKKAAPTPDKAAVERRHKARSIVPRGSGEALPDEGDPDDMDGTRPNRR